MGPDSTYVTENHSHYACALCTTAAGGAHRTCSVCKRRVLLLPRNSPVAATLARAIGGGLRTCPNGCGFTDAAHTCPRLAAPLPVVVLGAVYADFDTYAAQFKDDPDVHAIRGSGVVVRVLREPSTGMPMRVRVLHTQRHVEIVAVTSSAVAQADFVQRALLHADTKANDLLPLWPQHPARSALGVTVRTVEIRPCTLAAERVVEIYASPCARARWAAVFGSRFAVAGRRTRGATRCPVAYMNNSACLPAAYVATPTGVTCGACARVFKTHAEFLTACAPDAKTCHNSAPPRATAAQNGRRVPPHAAAAPAHVPTSV